MPHHHSKERQWSISSIFYARAFSNESKLSSFSLVTNQKHSLVIFGAKISYKKLARKTLMKLTPGMVRGFYPTATLA
jgi:hypothetical protein